MTRREFFDSIEGFGDLIDFLHDHDYSDSFGYIYAEETYNADITERLKDGLNYNNWEWQEASSFLEDIPDGYDYYREDAYGEYTGLSYTDFDSVMSELADTLEADDFFEPEYDEEEEHEAEEDGEPEAYVDPEDLIPIESEDVAMPDLFAVDDALIAFDPEPEPEPDAEDAECEEDGESPTETLVELLRDVVYQQNNLSDRVRDFIDSVVENGVVFNQEEAMQDAPVSAFCINNA